MLLTGPDQGTANHTDTAAGVSRAEGGQGAESSLAEQAQSQALVVHEENQHARRAAKIGALAA